MKTTYCSHAVVVLKLLAWLSAVTPAVSQELFVAKRFEVQTTKDVKYGVGVVNFSSRGGLEKDLLLDVYEPIGAGVPILKPGFILVHGGAWRYGSKESDRFESSSGSGDFNSAVSEYAMEFARRGYVCAVIDYRKIQDNPKVRGVLSAGPWDISDLVESIRATFASEFPPDQVRRGIEAGFDDTVQAINWLFENAENYGVDPTRIAVGGWSAGGVNSLSAAYLEGAPVRAVWSNSSGPPAEYIRESSQPAAIIFQGDMDTIASVDFTRISVQRLQSVGVPYQYFEMPGEDHFYLRTRSVSPTGETVEDLIASFFYEQMNLGIKVSFADENLEVAWFQGVLQSTGSISGEWRDVENATSPYPVDTLESQEFFRVRSE